MWAARGKTFAEISLILGCASTSVRANLDHCRYKLNCVTIAQTTAVAMALGILTADDLIGCRAPE